MTDSGQQHLSSRGMTGMESLRYSATCSICKNYFQCPKRMPSCGHVFCLGCICAHMAARTENYAPCPLCRTPIGVTLHDAHLLPSSTLHQELVDVFKARDRGMSESLLWSTNNPTAPTNNPTVPREPARPGGSVIYTISDNVAPARDNRGQESASQTRLVFFTKCLLLFCLVNFVLFIVYIMYHYVQNCVCRQLYEGQLESSWTGAQNRFKVPGSLENVGT